MSRHGETATWNPATIASTTNPIECTPYHDQPAAEYDERHRKRALHSLRKRAQSLGFDLVQADTGLILESPQNQAVS